MSPEPIAHSSDVERLIAEGYEVSIHHQHLVVDAVPYVSASRKVHRGALICPYSADDKPNDHTVWLKGEMPCDSRGEPLVQVINHSNPQLLFDKYEGNHYCSNKPDPAVAPGFPENYYEKIKHYVNLFQAQAKALDPDADARTGRVVESRSEESVFEYPDTASARAGISAISEKLKLARVAIIGLGGTGSYILDQVVKTPVKEIHLFDADDFKMHNAFRAPGAASLETLQRSLKKVDYYAELYQVFRKGIVTHPYHLRENNIDEIAGFDFVFVSVDDGISRSLICNYLNSCGVPFIDVGIGLSQDNQLMTISGQCRATMSTPEKNNHLSKYVDTADSREDALYTSNIQVADMNAMNALLAVIRWKQYFGFYADTEKAHNLNFVLSFQRLYADEKHE